mgnify:CR=1 FL=1
MSNQDLIGRFDGLRGDRQVIQEYWDQITRYITPYRGRFFKENTTESSIEWTQRHIYDSTAPNAHKVLSSTVHSGVSSPTIKWFDLRFRTEQLNRNKLAVAWLQEVGERVFYELQDSNFNLEVNETYQDICGYGTSFITLEEKNPGGKWGGLLFSTVPLKEGYFEEDYWGRILRFYRLMRLTPQQIISKFGDDVPQSIKDAEAGKQTSKRDVLFVITPKKNDIGMSEIRDWAKTAAPSRRTWEYRYILKDSAETLGKPGGYYEMPTFAPRWETTSDSMWGNSPAMVALADVMSLNEAREMQLKMTEKLIDPPILTEERALLTSLDMSAGALNTVRSIAGIDVFRSEGNFPVSDAMIQQLQDAIRNYFYVDQLQFPAPQAQPMTATEAQIRYEQLQRLMSTALARIRNDMLDPIVGRTTRMLARAGQLPEPPQIVLDENPNLDIEYMGSIARAQRVDQAAAIERVVGFAGGMAEVFPEALDSIEINEAMRWAARDLNVPADILRSADEVEALQEERKAKQAMAEKAAFAQEAGAGAQAVAEGQQAMEAAGGA